MPLELNYFFVLFQKISTNKFFYQQQRIMVFQFHVGFAILVPIWFLKPVEFKEATSIVYLNEIPEHLEEQSDQ